MTFVICIVEVSSDPPLIVGDVIFQCNDAFAVLVLFAVCSL